MFLDRPALPKLKLGQYLALPSRKKAASIIAKANLSAGLMAPSGTEAIMLNAPVATGDERVQLRMPSKRQALAFIKELREEYDVPSGAGERLIKVC